MIITLFVPTLTNEYPKKIDDTATIMNNVKKQNKKTQFL